MPLCNSISSGGGDLDDVTQKKLRDFFQILDQSIRSKSQELGVKPNVIKLMHLINYVVFVTIDEIIIIATNQNTGGIANVHFQDVKTHKLSIKECASIVERDLLYQNVFALTFSKSILEQSPDIQLIEAKNIANNYISEEVLEMEKLNNIVRINPIFQGRDFSLNKELVFMLSPFSEQYNVIYSDHIKPCVEKIGNLRCFRADNIYDNKPIIEDIWKSINESVIIISELSGRNPNVFYETGIAHTIGKEVILITQDINDVPFDLRHLRCIVYEYTPRGIQSLELNLENTIRQIISRS